MKNWTNVNYVAVGSTLVFAIVTAATLSWVFVPSSNAQVSHFVVTLADTGKPAESRIEPEQANSDGVVISQKDRAFSPASVTIWAHQSITIVNDDDTMHHVFCSVGDYKYNSGPMHVGDRVRIMFPQPGSYEVRCLVHPQMLLQVTVTKRSN